MSDVDEFFIRANVRFGAVASVGFQFPPRIPAPSASGRFQERFQRFKLHGTEFHLCREDSSFPDFLIPFLFYFFLKKKENALLSWETQCDSWWPLLQLATGSNVTSVADDVDCCFLSLKKRGESGSMARQWEEIKIPQEIGVEWEKKELSSRRLFRVFSF